MKTSFGVILVLSIAATFDSIAGSPPCNMTELSQLLVNANVRNCRSDSGYNPTSMTAATDAQVSAVCNSNSCTQAIKDVKRVAPNECTIGRIRLYADAIDPLERRCGRSSGSAGVAGSVSASGSSSGLSAGDVGYMSASGSGPVVGNTVSSASASMPGPASKSPVTSKPRTNTPTSTTRSGAPSTAPGNEGNNAPTLSTCAVIAVLAAVVAAIL